MVTPVAVPPEGTDAGRLVGGVPLALLVRDFHRPMLNFARTMVDSPAVAEETVQEAWLQVLRSSDSFQGRSSVDNWLFGIVKHTAAGSRGSAVTRCWPTETLRPSTRSPAACIPPGIPMPATGGCRRRAGSCPKTRPCTVSCWATCARRWTRCPRASANS